MKHALTFLGLILSVGILFVGSTFLQKPSQIQPAKKVISISTTTPQKSLTEMSAIVVPYWTFTKQPIEVSGYNTVVYFGITANSQGIASDTGFKNLKQFTANTGNFSGKKLLTLTLTDTSFNNALLENPMLQATIASQAVTLAKANGFSGVVLDFELQALAFDSVVKQITNFTNTIANAAKTNGLSFYSTAYGDTFYRLRPYDISELAKISDGIMVMAYDFHKANGDPGPNFPFVDDEYNFQKMTADFTKAVPKEKLTILFGMFGYDWTVDDKGRSTGPAQALTTHEIQQKFAGKILTDPNSLEKHSTYTDSFGKNHVVWFEDADSVQKKIDYLKLQGIPSRGYWAWSYF